MGVLKDILDTIKDIDFKTLSKSYLKNKKYSSISKMASEGILQFPVLVTDSLDIETLQMITKALERNYTTFVQVVLSMNPIMNLKNEKNIGDYLRKFHQNSDIKTDVNDLHNISVDLEESFNCLLSDDNKNVMITFIHEGIDRNLILKNKELLRSVYDDIVTECLNNKFIPRSNYTYNFINEASTRKYNKNNSIKSYKTNNPVSNSKEVGLPKMLLDNDVKKSNELIPTTLNVKLKIVNKDESDLGFINYIIGVKAVMHPIKSNDMIENLIRGSKNNNKFFDFIRWTTGEISFLKDLILNLNEIKGDVNLRSKGSSQWWLTLKRRKALSKMKNLITSKQILPNTTIVVSADEIEKIKSENGFDLMNESVVNKLMKTYFLLGFVVVDNSSQLAHFLFDGQQSFQTITFKSLERENINKSAEFKEMLKLVNRI